MNTTTQYWISRIVQDELEKVAKGFEGLPDVAWTGHEAARAIRLVVEQHAAANPPPSGAQPHSLGRALGQLGPVEYVTLFVQDLPERGEK